MAVDIENDMDLARLLTSIKGHEGYSAGPYLCTAGHWTIGYGHRLNDITSREQHETWFHNDVVGAVSIAERYAVGAWGHLNKNQREVLVEMAFQLGNRLWGFQRLRSCLRSRDHTGVVREMKDSRWYEQTTNRVEDLASKWLE